MERAERWEGDGDGGEVGTGRAGLGWSGKSMGKGTTGMLASRVTCRDR